jgi:XTP/dITP diphosphohydrolase
MWDSLDAEKFVGCCSSLSTKAIARAVVGYCDGMNVETFVGETPGILCAVPRGDRAFYWDTVFCPDGGSGKTYAEIVGADRSGLLAKLRISQSMRALVKFLEFRLSNEAKLFPAY